jgi:hypothetical protein
MYFTQQEIDTEIKHKKEVLEILNRNRRIIEQQKVKFGIKFPIDLQNELDDLNKEIENVEQRISELECTKPTPIKVQPKPQTKKHFLEGRNLYFSLILILVFTLGFGGGFVVAWFYKASDTDTVKLLQRLEFRYDDSPLEHGWVLVNTTPITFTHLLDNFQGITIETSEYNGIETAVSLDARKGNYIEFVIKPKGDAPMYAHINVRSKEDQSVSRDVWLKFYDEGETKKSLDNEYRINSSPISLSNGWKKFQINLDETVDQTFGKDGWKFSDLIGFRTRGNLSLAYIEVHSR